LLASQDLLLGLQPANQLIAGDRNQVGPAAGLLQQMVQGLGAVEAESE